MARRGRLAKTSYGVTCQLAPHGHAITAGDHGGVGMGGPATTDGIGWFVREHGLTIDHGGRTGART
ncbi:hypothetical protein ACWEQC_22730 [Streptomyces shenzhenensis]